MAKILEGRPNATINIEPGFLEVIFPSIQAQLHLDFYK
jgi:hypothetical protein